MDEDDGEGDDNENARVCNYKGHLVMLCFYVQYHLENLAKHLSPLRMTQSQYLRRGNYPILTDLKILLISYKYLIFLSLG